MATITPGVGLPRLSEVLAGHQFSEHHSGIIEATCVDTWSALHSMRWTDLRIAAPTRALPVSVLKSLDERILDTFTVRAGAVLQQSAPTDLLFAMVGKPWSPLPQRVHVRSLEEIVAFRESGWLKYGMEWALRPIEGNRTLVETRTLCEATDATSRRRFRAYWTLVKPGSALLRRDMIATLGRLCRQA